MFIGDTSIDLIKGKIVGYDGNNAITQEYNFVSKLMNHF